MGVFGDGERAVRGNLSFDTPVNQQVVGELNEPCMWTSLLRMLRCPPESGALAEAGAGAAAGAAAAGAACLAGAADGGASG